MNNSPSIQHGSRVFCPDHPEYGFGIVRLVEENFLDGQRVCQVAFDWIPGLTTVQETVLQAAASLHSKAFIPAEEWGAVEVLQRRLASALLMAENSRTGAFIRSFTSPLPHQAYVVEKIVTHRRFGHVIADDVGMGKTIEAGLVIAALRQRNPKSRVLILSPAGVVLQWQDEMDEHFGLSFSIAGRDFAAGRGGNWNAHGLVIGSLDTLKQEHLRETLRQIPTFDLVIFDEAHRLTARREFLTEELYRTQNYRFAEWLSQERLVEWESRSDGTPRSPRMLLLTATPHQGDDLRFAYLLQLVRPDLVEAESSVQPDGALSKLGILEECITRTPKRRAVDWDGKSIFRGHTSRTVDIALSESERAVLNRLTQYVSAEMQFATQGQGDQLIRALAMHTFQKVAASSWAALEAAMENRLVGKKNGEVVEGASMGQEFGFVGGEVERAALSELLAGIGSLPSDSKWNYFRELIRPGGGYREEGDRVLVFTQYRVTQSWLAERLSKIGERVAIIHGGLSLDERRNQRAFFEAEGTILISTEAGSEGANLHRKCHLEVNYDLPWNPMRLLQRIGRLDRYGQKHVVRVVNLRVPGSWDSEVSTKIVAKLGAVQASMGQIADEDYHSMILGEVHEAISVAALMQKAQWGKNARVVEDAVDEAIQKLLSRRSALDQLFRESIGMPVDFTGKAPSLSPDDFRQAFAWNAAAHQTPLQETRTSTKEILRGVYHFKLPEAFRAGFRATRECFVVFDRELFAEVRGETLGRVRGQEIKPSLAGFGEPVTDWMIQTGLHAGNGRSVFSAERSSELPAGEAWWIVFASRWKQASNWSGPDTVFILAVDSEGRVLRQVSEKEVFGVLRTLKGTDPESQSLPPLENATDECRKALRALLPDGVDTRMLILVPLLALQWKK